MTQAVRLAPRRESFRAVSNQWLGASSVPRIAGRALSRRLLASFVLISGFVRRPRGRRSGGAAGDSGRRRGFGGGGPRRGAGAVRAQPRRHPQEGPRRLPRLLPRVRPAGAHRAGRGSQLGYDGLAATAGEGWPDHIEAEDLRLTPVRPGLVYGTYRYRVRYGADEQLRALRARSSSRRRRAGRSRSAPPSPRSPGVPPPPRALVGATLIDGTGARAGPRRGRGAARRQDRVRRAARGLPGARGRRRGRPRGPCGSRPGWSTPTSTSRRPAGPTAARTRSTSATAHPYEQVDRRPRARTRSASAAPTSAPG